MPDLPAFSSITLDTDAKLVLIPGDSISVVISGSANLIESLELMVSGDLLLINQSGCTRNSDLEIEIVVPELTGVRIIGAGTVVANESIATENVTLDILGSGSMELNLEARYISTNIEGEGDLHLSGMTENLYAVNKGKGSMYAFDLLAKKAGLDIEGESTMEVTVEKELMANIFGEGQIYYKGQPEVNYSISGRGSVIPMN